ncbi:MAG: MBOAT family protein, partial [Verrucomicrobiota bacterium]
MLFNSYIYLLIFLPIVLIGYQLLRASPLRIGLAWLVLSSLVYFAYWKPDINADWTPLYLGLILSSCFGNFFFGRYLAKHHGPRGKRMLTLGIAAN